MSSSDDSQWDLAASPLLGVVRPYVIGEVEAWARRRGIDPLVGVDEVGKGALAGPVVAAAVALPPDHGLDRLNDSKQLTAADRQALVPQIEAIALAFGVGTVGPEIIDRDGINPATFQAMREALAPVVAALGRPGLVAVDGHLAIQGLRLPQRTWIKGDSRSHNIAAASVLAKVHRDRLMCELHPLYPQYGFDRHKGYGTAHHMAAIKQHGPLDCHRKTFRGVVRPSHRGTSVP